MVMFATRSFSTDWKTFGRSLFFLSFFFFFFIFWQWINNVFFVFVFCFCFSSVLHDELYTHFFLSALELFNLVLRYLWNKKKRESKENLVPNADARHSFHFVFVFLISPPATHLSVTPVQRRIDPSLVSCPPWLMVFPFSNSI